MTILCIRNDIADKIIADLKKKNITTESLKKMTSKARRKVFVDLTNNEDIGKYINTKFEDSIFKSRKDSIKTFIKKTFTKKQQEQSKDLIGKIAKLEATDLLDEKKYNGFLEDLISSKLGVNISTAETKEVIKMSKQLNKITLNVNENLKKMFDKDGKINKKNKKIIIDYFRQRKKINDYIQAINPTSRIKIITQLIGRGAMLFSIKSPILNIISNAEMTVVEKLTKLGERVGNKVLHPKQDYNKGLNNKMILDYVILGMMIFKESGFDISRMTSISDTSKFLGEKITSAQGKGAVRKVGRFYEDFVFKYLMGAPDIATSLYNFADSVNLISSKKAMELLPNGTKEEQRLKAVEIFNASTSLNPETIIDNELSDMAHEIRTQATLNAQYSTFTNKTKMSEFSLGVRDLINKATGQIGIGEVVLPFAVTPANVVSAIMDYGGVNAIFNIAGLPKAVKTLTDKNTLNDKGKAKKIIRSYVRAGLGMTLAFMLASALDPEDFIGEYPIDPKEAELMRLKNATPNSIKIGNKWISLDYFGPVGGAFTGIMYAKKYGKNLPDKVSKYFTGMAFQLLRTPGVDELMSVFSNVKSGIKETGEMDYRKMAKNMAIDGIDFTRSRTIPAIVSDVAKAMDDYKRVYDRETLTGRVVSNLPIIRTKLPKQTNIFGEPVKEEGAVASLFLGSRFKTANESPVVIEINRLALNKNLPSITSITRTSKDIKELGEKVGFEQLRVVVDSFGVKFFDEIKKLISSDDYEDMSDNEKRSTIGTLKSKILKETLLSAFDLDAVSKLSKKYKTKYFKFKKAEDKWRKKAAKQSGNIQKRLLNRANRLELKAQRILDINR